MEYASSLGALGFWFFLAAVVVGGMWFDMKKRESQQETLRRVVESGQQLDVEVIDRMLEATGGGDSKEDDLKTAGIIMFGVSLGLVILGYALSQFSDKIITVMSGVGGLTLMIGAALYYSGIRIARKREERSG